jgi:hypothetical protein
MIDVRAAHGNINVPSDFAASLPFNQSRNQPSAV